jgi:hypothetical protein
MNIEHDTKIVYKSDPRSYGATALFTNYFSSNFSGAINQILTEFLTQKNGVLLKLEIKAKPPLGK